MKDRVEPIFLHLREEGYLERPGVEVVESAPAPLSLVERVHTRHHVEEVGASGSLDVALLSTGGVVEGDVDNAFSLVGVPATTRAVRTSGVSVS